LDEPVTGAKTLTTHGIVAGSTILKIGTVVAVLLFAAPLAAEAQKAGKVYLIGVLDPTPVALNLANLGAFRQGMRELQYAEGQNFVIEYRSAEGRAGHFPDLAHELVRLKVDLILTRGTPAVTAAKNATRTIPIVMAASGDPLGAGVVTGRARPGGRTGCCEAPGRPTRPSRSQPSSPWS
jgi:ABC-type uncharacterized transport system substrate-binding protein